MSYRVWSKSECMRLRLHPSCWTLNEGAHLQWDFSREESGQPGALDVGANRAEPAIA